MIEDLNTPFHHQFVADLSSDQVRLEALLHLLVDLRFQNEKLETEIRILHASIDERLALWEEMKAEQ